MSTPEVDKVAQIQNIHDAAYKLATELRHLARHYQYRSSEANRVNLARYSEKLPVSMLDVCKVREDETAYKMLDGFEYDMLTELLKILERLPKS